MNKRSVNENWEIIFDDFDVLNKIQENGYFEITANQIKKYHEPRLMTKFDFSKSRPPIFKKHNISILPIDNGTYLLGEFDLYHKLEDIGENIKVMKFPRYIESIDLDEIYSESNALNVALLSGMLNDIVSEDVHETISGRMRATKFNFKVKQGKNIKDISVSKPQIEIDGGYESQNKILMVEAKNREPEDFIIRQLYYPYRFWKAKVDKEIVPIFFTYKNGIYSFYIYKFTDDKFYNSIKLVKSLKYSIKFDYHKSINLNSVNVISEPVSVPFPQADTFNIVIDIIHLVYKGYNTAEKISNFLEFSSRQGNYYITAAKYLGLIAGNKNYFLSNVGNEIIDMNLESKNMTLAKLILEHAPFLETAKLYLKNDRSFPDSSLIMRIIKISINKPINITTLNRRSKTVIGWLKWIINSGIKIEM